MDRTPDYNRKVHCTEGGPTHGHGQKQLAASPPQNGEHQLVLKFPVQFPGWENMRREEKRLDAARLVMVSALVPILRQTAELAGFEIIGRIPLRDKATGKEYR